MITSLGRSTKIHFHFVLHWKSKLSYADGDKTVSRCICTMEGDIYFRRRDQHTTLANNVLYLKLDHCIM